MSSNPSIKLLIAEDEKNLGLVLQKEMSRLGHQVTLVHDAEAAIKTAREAEFDVALLDIMMPGRSGLEVLRELRQQDQPPEVLMMTGHATVETALQAMKLGAYDYLTKPFSFAVLLARLRAASRRQDGQPTSLLRVADLVLNRATMQVFRGRREINLTATEFRLLEFLMRRPGVVVSRNAIVEAVWGFDDEVNDNTVDAFIRLVRRKIDDPHEEKLIRTVRGMGYALRASQ